jgi:RNA polymerase sigma-70 factor (ECF subfamily)
MNIQEFQKTVFPLKDKLFRFAKRFLEQQEEAEDIVQEAFIRLWNRRDHLDQYRSVEALAMVTTKNLCLDKLKTRKFPVENLDNHRIFLENLPSSPIDDHSDLILRIRNAMNQLPEQQRTIIHLRDVEGYEFSEIAGIVGMHENAIRVALSRARKRIREQVNNSKSYEYKGN